MAPLVWHMAKLGEITKPLEPYSILEQQVLLL
jgi:hypothetical protein